MASWIFWYNSNYFYGQVQPPLVNHGLSMGGSKSHTLAVMLANLPFSLWLLVNTTTAQYCLPAFSFSLCQLSSAQCFLPSGVPGSHHVIWEAQRSSWKENLGDHCSGVLTANLKPCGRVFCSQQGSALRFHQGTLRRKVLATIVLCQEHPAVPTAGLAPSSMFAKNSTGFWPLSSCAGSFSSPTFANGTWQFQHRIIFRQESSQLLWTTCRVSFSFYQSHIGSVFVTPSLLPTPCPQGKHKELRGFFLLLIFSEQILMNI